MILQGKVFKYGDNVDTDVIIPARYLNSSEPANLAAHCMEDLDQDFASQVEKGDIIVGGKNFGSGSSREHAPLAIKYAGVACVVAESFARIFYRNSINIGLPILECPAAVQATQAGDKLEVNLDQGTVKNLRTGETFEAAPFPEFMQEIIADGGLIEHIKKELV
ncbi:3-isopropylmalate dehydratase small subunit [Halanaerobium salsuginis]|jgi:3-isopropylmalate/(R)-2-methylmalate dehydratase small subunit|uniref:3-isopropylmalate dehydratase small subunit n=1 Tax=Halanaerobium salsuginis TaxID=29563 RepID=A0A1I4ESW0_9FIRM|nr:3-isopropylmalate dehydratase small subunit [Halanaerobium salsuginis]SFL08802.1 3-isopropylmalate/(R)-2-methylmalate dehydratase small subunit [Halanaerobium salsuginis]